nr:hypothetical protein [Actinomadura sp. J1-007]
MLSDAAGLPLVVVASAANVHDSQAFKPLLMSLPAIRPGADRAAASRSRTAPTRPTIPPSTWPGCTAAESCRASPEPA